MKIIEEEIRHEVVFNEYLKLTAKYTIMYFSNAAKSENNCPACGGKGSEWAAKDGFNYKLCPGSSVYVSLRPVMDAFNTYYTGPPSTKFWATTL